MKKYPTLSEEFNALPEERQESIKVRSAQIRLEEIDAALVEMAQDPEYQATVTQMDTEFATASWDIDQVVTAASCYGGANSA